MQCEALEKVISIARKNSKILLSPAFFEKICARLEVNTRNSGDKMIFTKNDRTSEAVIINAENCAEYKCMVKEGAQGIRIYEFIKAMVELLTDIEIPPSPYEKMGQTAAYYCEKGIEILEDKFLKGAV